MSDDISIFNLTYVPESVAASTKSLYVQSANGIDVKIEQQRYGLSKPRRIVIRGKITSDKGEKDTSDEDMSR